MSVLACVCNGRIVYGDGGGAPLLPLLFIVPAALLLIAFGVWVAVRRARARPALTGPSRPAPREPVEAVEEPGDVPAVVEPVGVHSYTRRDEQSDVHAPFP